MNLCTVHQKLRSEFELVNMYECVDIFFCNTVAFAAQTLTTLCNCRLFGSVAKSCMQKQPANIREEAHD